MLHPTAPSVWWSCLARSSHVPGPCAPGWGPASSPPEARRSRPLAHRQRALPGGRGRLGRLPLPLGRAGRPLGPSRQAVGPRTGLGEASPPRWPGPHRPPSTPRTWRCGGAGACGLRPLALPPPCGRPGPGSDGACLAGAHGPHASRPCRLPTARTPGPAWGRPSRPRPTGMAAPRGVLTQRCRTVSQGLWRAWGPTPPSCTPWHAPWAIRPHRPPPSPWPAGPRCLGSAPSCAWGAATPSLPWTACHGATMWSPPAASSRAPRRLRGHALAPRAPRSGRPRCPGPSRQPRSWASARLPPAPRRWPAASHHTGRAPRGPCWPRRAPGRSPRGANAPRRARGRWCSSRRQARSGCARRRTGRVGEAPGYRARGCLAPGVVPAQEPRGLAPCALPVLGPPLRLWDRRREAWRVAVGCPSPAPGTPWRPVTVPPPLCRGRDEGPARWLGRRDHPERSLHASASRRAPLPTWVVPPPWGTRLWPCRRTTLPGTDGARSPSPRKDHGPNPLRGNVGLLTTRDLIRVGPSVPHRLDIFSKRVSHNYKAVCTDHNTPTWGPTTRRRDRQTQRHTIPA
jgi:hypothetical protein